MNGQTYGMSIPNMLVINTGAKLSVPMRMHAVHYGTALAYSPASRFTLRLVGLGSVAEACLAGALPFFLACGTSLFLWLVVAVVAFFGGTVAFLALGLDLGGCCEGAQAVDVSATLGKDFSKKRKESKQEAAEQTWH